MFCQVFITTKDALGASLSYLFIHRYVTKNAIIISNLSGIIVEWLSQISRIMLQYLNFSGYYHYFLVSGSFGMVSLYPLFRNVWCR